MPEGAFGGMTDEKSADRPLLNFEESLALCLKPFRTEDEDIIQENVSVSFIDPISYVRIASPCRTIYCDHVQCFDYNCYASLNARRPAENWACPICRAKAAPELVYVDYIFTCLISLFPQSEGATVYSSGTFEGRKPVEKQEESSVTVIDLVSDDETDQPETKAASGVPENYLQKLHDFPELKGKPTMSIVQIKNSITMRSILRLMNHLSSAELKRLNGVGDKLAKEITALRPWMAQSEAELLKQLQSIKLVGKKKALNIVEQLKALSSNSQPTQVSSQVKLQHVEHRSAYSAHFTDAIDALRSLSQAPPVQQVRPPQLPRQHPTSQRSRLEPLSHMPHQHRFSSHDPRHPSNHHSASSLLASHYYAVFPPNETTSPARAAQSSSGTETVYIDMPAVDVTSNEHSRIDDPIFDFTLSPVISPPQEDTVMVPNMDFCAVFDQVHSAPSGRAITGSPEDRPNSPHKRPRTASYDQPTLGSHSTQSEYPSPWPSPPGQGVYPVTSQQYQHYTLMQPQCSYPSASTTSQQLSTSHATATVTDNTCPAPVEPVPAELFDFLVEPW